MRSKESVDEEDINEMIEGEDCNILYVFPKVKYVSFLVFSFPWLKDIFQYAKSSRNVSAYFPLHLYLFRIQKDA